jgi:hypothetical protein
VVQHKLTRKAMSIAAGGAADSILCRHTILDHLELRAVASHSFEAGCSAARVAAQHNSRTGEIFSLRTLPLVPSRPSTAPATTCT